MSACMIQSKNGPQYQNTVKEKFTNNQILSYDQRKSKSERTRNMRRCRGKILQMQNYNPNKTMTDNSYEIHVFILSDSNTDG